MGWWEIRDVETGQINWEAQTANRSKGIINAIPGEDPTDKLYNGDEPADIMDDTLRKISKVYEKAWGRPAKKEELTACFNFCCNGMFRDDEKRD